MKFYIYRNILCKTRVVSHANNTTDFYVLLDTKAMLVRRRENYIK